VSLPRHALRAPPLTVTLADFPRIIKVAHVSTPLGLSNGTSRFSSTAGTFQILYAAERFETALAEAVVRDRFESRHRRFIGRTTLMSRAVTTLSTTAPMSLFDLRAANAYALGIDTDAARGRAHSPGQEFSEALYAQTAIDGILYDSRLTGGLCVAIYDRAVRNLVASPSVDLIRHVGLIPELQRLDIIVRGP